ncbi:hypothetical protein DFP72DRAFT_1171416 [Ephemerocybe angulata]|uniref:Uncharacterized protein n=1 Tax=Ephemerocybe angulata TaxID=980116 RepID=A0A8H6HU57_9AGAR|nr:hypothetical protein DFP72DRAFT_1171416 [Tulosesus angulatus]
MRISLSSPTRSKRVSKDEADLLAPFAFLDEDEEKAPKLAPDIKYNTLLNVSYMGLLSWSIVFVVASASGSDGRSTSYVGPAATLIAMPFTVTMFALCALHSKKHTQLPTTPAPSSSKVAVAVAALVAVLWIVSIILLAVFHTQIGQSGSYWWKHYQGKSKEAIAWLYFELASAILAFVFSIMVIVVQLLQRRHQYGTLRRW